MIEYSSISIKLPLKISVWKDIKESVWATFPQMQQLVTDYEMDDNPIIINIQTLLEGLVTKTVYVY
ncbi:hypothetical protein SAMN05444349_10287 [Bacteroides faecichinchillae]|uniref:Uncharacterized protein n=2 Tax=Bacteroides faecichinchillae TaxID=871325 RepID=A0A1M4TDN0_9BACE|nr:hypothetical protein [Bacteroides faecichinchillae]THG56305.1 hypothetical protein E5981_16900 [Bacteroides faecichinchillae]SHE42474.1 hypothetical protein SAMN05444349_10287 [Bacteroides faecichinchillae]